MRLIDADALQKEVNKHIKSTGSIFYKDVIDLITNAPTVQREPVNEGYPLIRLGYGLVEVGTGEVDGEPVVMFTNHGNGVIGDNTVEEPRVNDPKDVYAAISITNLDSLNVVRKQLDIFASKYLNEVAPTVQREGWVSVPRKLPDDEMRQVIVNYFDELKDGRLVLIEEFWNELLSAAPTVME